jgi:flagellar motility protein MotE (MotC chaperone)
VGALVRSRLSGFCFINPIRKEERGPMKFKIHAAAAAMLAASLVVSFAHAQSNPPEKRHRRETAPPPPSVQDQIDALRQQMQSQIDQLKSDLANKDAQLQQAQQAASDAAAAAAKAQAAADAEQQVLGENQTAVSSLQSTVNDMKSANAAVVSSITEETTAIKKQVANPDALYFKGITISPTGSFLAGETVWRGAATAGDINTAFTGVPLANSEAYNLSEFFASGRQSRAAVKAQGKLSGLTLTGYYEADWLSSGTTSNNNQSNSYTMRQRQLWADAKTDSGWDFSGGQGWSLATETTQGLTRGTEILPATIDAQYEAGFVWARQESFRMSKDFGKAFFLGASVENAETLNPGGQNLPSNILLGSAGTNGGLYNAAESASGSNLVNYSFNYTPDFVAKIAVEPGWGHWELFGIGRSFRDRIYPSATAIASQAVCGSATTPCNSVVWGGGVGGGFRGPLFDKKLTIGLKGLWGDGVGRYGSSTIADVTLRPDGTISPLHGFSALSTVELNPTSRLNLYFNYGGDYISRDWTVDNVTGDTLAGKTVGYGAYNADMSGCGIEPASTTSFPTSDPTTPGNSTNGCKGNNKDVQEFTAGWWYNIVAGPKGRLRQGLQYSLIRRDLWSGNGGTLNPSSGAHGDDNMVFTSFRYYLP